MRRITNADLRRAAKERTEAKKHLRWTRPLCDDFWMMGLAGEKAFHDYFEGAYEMDLTLRKGDGGVDFTTEAGTVDVKTTRGHRLLFEHNKRPARFIVLAKYDDHTETAHLLGWCFSKDLLKRKPYDTGRGIINHVMEVRELRPMDKLKEYIAKKKARLKDEPGD